MNRDPEIHGLLDEIDGLLAQMPREQRLREFERMLKPRSTDFIHENEGASSTPLSTKIYRTGGFCDWR